MTLNRALTLTSVGLGVALIIQVAFHVSRPPVQRWHASWIDRADTVKEGIEQSDHIVIGKVRAVRMGEDIVVPARGEPNDEDRVPTQVVQLAVEKVLMGAPGRVIDLFQTGRSTDAETTPPIPDNPDEGIQGFDDDTLARFRPREPPLEQAPTAGDDRATILEDDPPYHPGERYLLFLTEMQGDTQTPSPRGIEDLQNRGKMMRVLAPEGRLQITKGGTLKPVTLRRGFAPEWVGRKVGELEEEIRKFVGSTR